MTVALMATILTSIFALQGSLFRAISHKHSVLDRVFVLRNLFFDYEKLDNFKENPTSRNVVEEDHQDPRTAIVFEAKNIAEEFYPFLYRLESTGKWQGMFKPQEETVAGLIFAYVPEDREKEKKEDKKSQQKVVPTNPNNAQSNQSTQSNQQPRQQSQPFQQPGATR